MTVESLAWLNDGGQDIHLLPDTVSPRLDHLLAIRDTSGNRRADNPHTGVSVSFEAQFVGTASGANQFTGHGVTVDTQTGEVTVAGTLPSGAKLRNFIVVCKVQEGANTFEKRVRFHVHESISGLWLTPNPLTVREGASGVRLSPLAKFADDTIGDLSNWSPFLAPQAADRTFVRLSGSTSPIVDWQSDRASQIAVARRTGVLDCKPGAVSANITAAIAAASGTPTTSDPGQARHGPPWNTPVQADLVAGPGIADMATASNVLILPDGFQAADETAFRNRVRILVGALCTRRRTRPFNLLKDKINYFTAWVPSPDAGTSPLAELAPFPNRRHPNEFSEFDHPKPAATGSVGGWSLAEMIHEVGLPTPVDDPSSRPRPGRLSDWRALYDPLIQDGDVSGEYDKWLNLNKRTLLNERDTAFHTKMGKRPHADGGTKHREVHVDRRRVSEDDFDSFLDAITDSGAANIGADWKRGGRDQDYIIFLARTGRHGGVNSSRVNPANPSDPGTFVGVTMGHGQSHRVAANSVGHGSDLVPDAVPPKVHVKEQVTLAHELAHSFPVGDEYGTSFFTMVPIWETIPPEEAANEVHFVNIHARNSLLSPDPANPGQQTLDPGKIKWNLPRVEKAGVMTKAPTVPAGPAAAALPSGTRLTVTLVKGQAAVFANVDIVKLRARPLLTAGDPSDRLKVVNVQNDDLELEVIAGSSITRAQLATFVKDSIVIAPVRGSATTADPLGPDLNLMAEVVRARIESTRNALNAPDSAAPNTTCQGVKYHQHRPQFPNNFPGLTNPAPPGSSHKLVGLYESGMEYDCGVYHPSPACLMGFTPAGDNSSRDPTMSFWYFCPVCQYILVDEIDPTQHREIDSDYTRHYPP